MKKLVSVKVASAVIAGLGLTVGAVGVVGASTGSIAGTGEDSHNKVRVHTDTTHNGTNNTGVGVTNNNPQTAVSGHATVKHSEDLGGSAESGTAGNESDMATGGTFSYGGSGEGSAPAPVSASISETGEDSHNKVKVHSTNTVNQTNNTSVGVTNNNTQTAVSGHATVEGNEEGGSATSGDVSNKSTMTTTLSATY